MLRLVDESVAAPPPGASPIGWGFNESPYEFARRSLQELEIECTPSHESLARIPTRGRTIFVANHPFGALDGLLAIALLGAVRSDLRLLAGSDLAVVPELAPLMFGVDPFAKGRNTQRNAQALRYALRWLEHEHAVLAFPAGGIAHFDVRARCVTDPPWSTAIGQIIRMTGAQVVPVHISGTNSKLFQLAGVVSSRLRTFMLPREIRRQRRSRIAVEVGTPIPAARLGRFGDNEAVAMHLRLKTFLAATQSTSRADAPPDADRSLEVVASAMPIDAQAREVESLSAENLLVQQGELQVYLADAADIPHVLSEIGRLRELTSRGMGAGTGRARNLDRFDRNHEHLFVWHSARHVLVGGCRIGRTDVIRDRDGKSGLCTVAQFKFRDPFLALLGRALELDQFFANADHRGDAPLMLLWKGIGELVGRDPRYCRLIGPLRIGGDYSATSRQLLVGFLRTHCIDPMFGSLVSARLPLRHPRSLGSLTTELAMLRNLDPLDALIEDIEPDGKGVPVMLRQHLKLGGRVLDFCADAESGHSIDCLMMLDLRHAKPRTLRKYLSESAMTRFESMHRRIARAGKPAIDAGTAN